MQQFQVPQFIDVEDKVFGPLTVKQFFYLLAGGASVVVLFFIGLPKILFFLLAVVFGSLFMALAFLKINGRPFELFLNNALNHVTHPRMYIWKRGQKKAEIATPGQQIGVQYTPKLTESKLKELSWSLDINKVSNR